MRYPSAEINGSCFEPKIGTDNVIKRSKVAKLNTERFGALLAVRSNNFRIYVTDALTLLVNSKTPWMATLHPTVEGQRDRSCCVKQCAPMLLEIQWPRLNQQSLSIAHIDHQVWRSHREEAKRGPPSGQRIPRNEGVRMSLLLPYAPTGVSLLAE